MEFWGSEVKSGETIKVTPEEGRLLHLSQASLGESKKDKSNEAVTLYVNVDGKKHVLGTLFAERIPQQPFDLVFHDEFELSHNWKSGSVYFFGYRADNVNDEVDVGADFESDTDSSESESDDDIPLLMENNVKPEVVKPEEKAKEEKATDAKKSDKEKDAAPKKKGKAEEVTPIIKSEDEDSDDSMEDVDDQSTDSDEDDGESDSEDTEEDSEEDTPVKKVETGKKRASDSEPKTPAANKKVKLATPQKTDGKTGGSTHVATPHPSKQTDKKPKSGGGSHTCKSCSRTFGSESGLESHTKAKHSDGK